MRSNRERLEDAIADRRVTWHRLSDDKPRRVFLACPPAGHRRLLVRPLNDQERKILHALPVRYMRRRDDAPGVSRGIVLMAE